LDIALEQFGCFNSKGLALVLMRVTKTAFKHTNQHCRDFMKIRGSPLAPAASGCFPTSYQQKIYWVGTHLPMSKLR
jgi:hypothetical protein